MAKADKDNLTLSTKLQSSVNRNIFEQIVENFPDIIHSVDDKGIIVSTNKRASELLGYNPDELVGKSVESFYAPEVIEAMKEGFANLKKEGLKQRTESKLRAKDGTIIDVEVRSLSIYDEQGKFVKTFSIIRDIRELITLRTQIVQQSKLAAIGELASGIMHDIRNPLTVIVSYNEKLALARQAQSFDALDKCRERIGLAASKIERLSNHLRQYVRKEVETPEKFHLSTLMDDCLLMLESKIRKGNVDVINHLKNAEPIEIVGRPGQLEQVFINIISNACDAVKDCAETKVILRAVQTDDRVQLSIKDTGTGIKEEHLDQIFDAFFTTKPRGMGTGLGLSITNSIISEQGGLISVKSQLGKGTEFMISMPLDVANPLKRDDGFKLQPEEKNSAA